MITAGIDIGTRWTKAALIEDGEEILALEVVRTGFDFQKAAEAAFRSSLEKSGLRQSDVCYVTATGMGRYRVAFRDINVTDITANARGAKLLFPNTNSVLDVGAGNARAMKVGENGKVLKFKATDRCAAGGGAFLEKVAFYARMDLDELSRTALRSKNPVQLSTVCSIFAESEVINLMTQEVPIEDILMGAHLSVIGRVVMTLKQVGVQPEVTLTGGLVHNPASVRALEERLGLAVNASSQLHYAAAIGAAHLGYLRLRKKIGGGASR